MSKSSVTLCKLVLSTSGVACVIGASARAQSAPDAPSESAKTGVSRALADNSKSSELAEIIVTAQKRAESIQEVPLAVAAFSQAALAEHGVSTVLDLGKLVPGLHVESGYGETSPRFNMRGVGNTEYATNASPAVGVYVDEVYLNNTSAQGFQLFDQERIEVLRGPQGTLWGKNTTAGVVQAISAKPTNTFEGYGRIEVGDFGRKILESAISGPLSDTLSARFAGITNSYAGYFYNSHLQRRAGDANSYGVRASLLWTPIEDVDLLLRYSRAHTDQELVYGHYGLLAGDADSRGATPTEPLYVTPSDHWVVNSNAEPRGRSDMDNVTATLHYRFGAGYELTNVLSYVKAVTSNYEDDDSAPYVYSSSWNYGAPTQFSDELRVASASDRSLSWIVGAYYLREALDGSFLAYYPDYGDLGYGYNVYYPRFHQTTRSEALFGTLAFKPTDQWSLSAGVRESNEKKAIGAFAETLLCDKVEWFNERSCTAAKNFLTGAGTPVYNQNSSSVDDTVTTWDANAKYQATSSVMLWGRIAKGFRAGTFDPLLFTAAPITTLRPETIIDYEGGIKSGSSGGRWRGNLTGFYYNYNNYQVEAVNGARTALGNTTLKLHGVEVELTVRPISSWTIGGDAAFIDHKFGNYIAPVSKLLVPSGHIDLTGQPLAKAPKSTAHIYTSFAFTVAGGRELELRTDWNYSSYTFMKTEYANLDAFSPSGGITLDQLRASMTQPAFWLGDVSATLEWTKHLEVSAFVRNVTNELYKLNSYTYLDATPIGGGRTAAALAGPAFGKPRTLGVAVNFKF